MTTAPTRTGISGLGLMGGSLARAISRSAPGIPLLGSDPDPAARDLARASGLFARVEARVEDVAGDVERLVLAGPVDAIAGDLRTVGGMAGAAPALVMDLGSTKAGICAAAAEAGLGDRFVGGHPIAGAETRGFASADAGLYEGAAFVLCAPPATTGGGAMAAAEELVALVGARSLRMDAALHDRIVAATSHLPQLLAVALAASVADLAALHPEALALTGGGFRDLTRIASSAHGMWAPILDANREAVAEAQAALLARLDEAGDPARAAAAFARGAELRSRLPVRRAGAALRVELEQGTSSLAAAIAAVAGAGVAIREVALERRLPRRADAAKSSEEPGTLRLAFDGEAERERARAALRAAGLPGLADV